MIVRDKRRGTACRGPLIVRGGSGARAARQSDSRRRRIPGFAETCGCRRSYGIAADGAAAPLPAESRRDRLGKKFDDDLPRAHRLADAVSEEKRSDIAGLVALRPTPP